jgi:hypothetical protein
MSMREPLGHWLLRELPRTALAVAGAAAIGYMFYVALMAALRSII